MKYKMERIKNLITREIMSIVVKGDVKDPRIPKIFTITNVTVSKDLHYCHVYISMIEETNIKTVLAGFNSASPFFQKELGERLKFKFTPKIEFRYDEIEANANKLDKIFQDIAKKREEEVSSLGSASSSKENSDIL